MDTNNNNTSKDIPVNQDADNAAMSIFFGILACIFAFLYAFGHGSIILYMYLIVIVSTFGFAGGGISSDIIKARWRGVWGVVLGVASIAIIIAGYFFGYFGAQ